MASLASQRTEPVTGTQTAGFSAGQVLPSKWLNWISGLGGDWTAHLDSDTLRLSAYGVSDGNAARTSSSRLGFQIGGALLQYPVTGGTYQGRRQHLDATATGSSSGALFAFNPSTTNYVWLRAPLSRSSYPDIAVTVVPLPPASDFVRVLEVVTDALSVLSESEPPSLHLGPRIGSFSGASLTSRTPLRIESLQNNATELVVNAQLAGTAAAATIQTIGATVPPLVSTRPLLHLGSEALQVSVETSSRTTEGAVLIQTFSDCAAIRTVTGAGESQAVALVSDPNNLASAWILAATPCLLPPNAPPWTGRLRLAATITTEAGGLRWRDPSAGDVWIPRASRISLAALPSFQGPDSGALAGGFVGVLVTTNVNLLTGHSYLIRIEIEALATALVNFGQTVTITVNGVAQAPWNAKGLHAVRNGLASQWLTTTVRYYHAGVDIVGAPITVSVAHGIGAGTVTYLAPRITIDRAEG